MDHDEMTAEPERTLIERVTHLERELRYATERLERQRHRLDLVLGSEPEIARAKEAYR